MREVASSILVSPHFFFAFGFGWVILWLGGYPVKTGRHRTADKLGVGPKVYTGDNLLGANCLFRTSVDASLAEWLRRWL